MKRTDFQIRLPKDFGSASIDEEYFFLTQHGQERKLMLHDYAELYQIPGLYEYLVFEILGYQSPRMLSSLLIEQVTQAQDVVSELVVLEIGAGSGLMGKALANLGVKSITGMDIIPEAAQAAKREYPEVYENYYVEDLAKLSEGASKALESRGFNCLVCCSALSHIPTLALSTAFNLIQPNGWLAFNVIPNDWHKRDANGFVGRHSWVGENDVFEVRGEYPYLHRYYMDGRPLEYVAIIGTKIGQIS